MQVLTRQARRQLFAIADAELVRVSAKVGELEELLSEVQDRLELTESKLAELEASF